jgi:TM2 domain-containing membrane protein YozV
MVPGPMSGYDFNMYTQAAATHNKLIGYLFWIFGFTGAHRFYYGRPVTGVIWLLTGGLLGIGWLYDFCTLNSQVDERNRWHRP